jgi:hypothetical protein
LTGDGGPVPPWPPGSLGIKDFRAWKTWHLVTVAVVMLLLGMAIGHAGNGTAAGEAARPLFTPPPAAEVNPPTPATATATAPPATRVAPDGAVEVLVPRMQGQGPASTSVFAVADGTWNIGWAFDCGAAPAAARTFRILAVARGGASSAQPVVDQRGRAASGVTPRSSGGTYVLDIETAPGCRWAVKVAGVRGTETGAG